MGIGMTFGCVLVGALIAGATGAAGAAGAATSTADKTHAQHALVALTDLPGKWTSNQVPTTSSSTFTGSPQLAQCLGVPTGLIANNPPHIVSPVFQNQGGSELVQDTVSIYPTTSRAKAVYTALSSRKAVGCFNSLLNSASSGSAGRVTVTRVTSPKDTVAFVLDATVSGTGTTATPTSTEFVYFFHGTYGNGLDVETSGSSPPTALTQHLLALTRSRL
jgi:hypothetical protein